MHFFHLNGKENQYVWKIYQRVFIHVFVSISHNIIFSCRYPNPLQNASNIKEGLKSAECQGMLWNLYHCRFLKVSLTNLLGTV